jgi:hypothetical protein
MLDKIVLPFIKRANPEDHRLIMDNDPKHSSKYAKDWMEPKGVH